MWQVLGGQIVVHHEIGRTHILHTLGLGMGHLSTSGAGLAHLLSEAMARKTGDDCAVEIALASTDHVNWVSAAASLDLAEDVHLVVLSARHIQVLERLAEGVHLVVLSARQIQVLGRLAEEGGLLVVHSAWQVRVLIES
jgi:hypothetical protein